MKREHARVRAFPREGQLNPITTPAKVAVNNGVSTDVLYRSWRAVLGFPLSMKYRTFSSSCAPLIVFVKENPLSMALKEESFEKMLRDTAEVFE